MTKQEITNVLRGRMRKLDSRTELAQLNMRIGNAYEELAAARQGRRHEIEEIAKRFGVSREALC